MLRDKDVVITPQLIQGCIKEHQEGLDRLKKLKAYFKGEHKIVGKRRINPNAPNNIIVVPNAFYITTVANGFTFANPITYKSSGNIDSLLAEYKLAKAASHDAELGEDLSIYGRAYELIYMSEQANHVKLNNLNPENTFVVYSNEIDPEPLFAVYYYFKTSNDNVKSKYIEANIYDNEKQYVCKIPNINALPTIYEGKPHYGGQVPIVEYKNNDEAIGDFERVISLIDAYDRLQSDRLDDKDQFIDAILAIYGSQIVDNPDDVPEAMKRLKIYKILELPQEARAEYIKNALDENSVETLRQSLKQDISKFSMVPELTDESFASAASGVAMEYKTLGLKWLGNTKRRMFKKGLDHRLQIMNTYMSKLGRGFSWEDIDVIFDDALPINKEALMPYAQSILSRKTMVANLANAFGVSDVEREIEDITQEKSEELEINSKLFNNQLSFGQGDAD